MFYFVCQAVRGGVNHCSSVQNEAHVIPSLLLNFPYSQDMTIHWCPWKARNSCHKPFFPWQTPGYRFFFFFLPSTMRLSKALSSVSASGLLLMNCQMPYLKKLCVMLNWSLYASLVCRIFPSQSLATMQVLNSDFYLPKPKLLSFFLQLIYFTQFYILPLFAAYEPASSRKVLQTFRLNTMHLFFLQEHGSLNFDCHSSPVSSDGFLKCLSSFSNFSSGRIDVIQAVLKGRWL